MPIGVLTNCSAVLLGGLTGCFAGKLIPEKTRNTLTTIFGFCAISIGINSIIKVQNMAPVIISIVLGFIIGDILDLEKKITAAFSALLRRLPLSSDSIDMSQFLTIAVIFCASGLGIYGSLTEGMSGNSSILLSKAVLDFFTAVTFACSMGAAVSVIAAPMLCIMMALYCLASFIGPMVSPVMLQDFMACGGILTLAAGSRMAGIKSTPIANLIPALVLALPLSALWTALMG